MSRVPRTVDPGQIYRRKVKAHAVRMGMVCDCEYPYPTRAQGVQLHELTCPVVDPDLDDGCYSGG